MSEKIQVWIILLACVALGVALAQVVPWHRTEIKTETRVVSIASEKEKCEELGGDWYIFHSIDFKDKVGGFPLVWKMTCTKTDTKTLGELILK